MTNEEVIKYAKETKFCCGCPIDFSQEDDSSKCDVCEHRMFFESVIKTFETQIEYRWHDLRIDPNDLPRDMEYVQICWLGGSNNWYDSMFWDADRKVFSVCSNTEYEIIHPIIGDERYCKYGEAIAWRRIEPFESDF